MRLKSITLAIVSLAALTVGTSALAQKKYDQGATDKEIKIGGISPYSGPASAYGAIGKAITAYFEKVNAEGGVNGRKLTFISLDDGYNPAKTVEQARKLVEEEEVLFIFNTLGTPPNSAIHKYMNSKKTPQLFVATGATKWGDPKNFPWTMGWQPNYQSESKVFAAHLLETKPNAKVAILYQNDDYGKDYLKGFEDGLGDKAKTMIVSKISYEVTDPTIDSQMVSLKATGADTFFNITTPKFAAHAIKKAAEIGWKPTHYLNSVSASVGSVMNPAGPENGVGIYTASYLKDPTDPQFQKGKEWDDWLAWMTKYQPKGDVKDVNNVYGYTVAQGLVQV
ncbi:MAG: ABC transporter substrate-binding protein, partial [Aquabacterium sp.]|nr:ABC transporter substrate-binding protein [Aquabacterium sp.]